MRVQRSDTSRLAKFVRTGAGAVRVPATVGRTGVQIYDGVGEYRPPEEVFSAASLASFASVPVTLNHPPVSVTPANAGQYQRGVVSDAPPEARVKVDADPHEWVRTQLVVTHGDLLDALENDTASAVSCGYSCDLEPHEGVSPDGTPYKFIQRNIVLNHVAVLTKDTAPRAGASAKVRLDNKDPKDIMKLIVIDGVELEYGSEKHFAALAAAADKKLAAETARADVAQAKADTESARADGLQAKLDTALAASKTDAIDAAVEARYALLTRAAKFLPAAYETKGKTDSQIRLDALTAALGAAAVEGKSPAYLEARFDGLFDPNAQAQFHNPRRDGAPASSTANDDSDEAFRAALAKKDEAK